MRLKLYVIARSKGTDEVIRSVREMLDEAFPDQHTLEVIDVLEDPAQAEQDSIFVTPLLYKLQPDPPRKVVGDFRDKERLLQALNVDSAR